jgi:hypothetical protein
MSEGPPFTPPPPANKKQEDLNTKHERARAAKDLLEDKAFQYALLKLRQQWFQELLIDGGGGLTGARLCAKINALESVATELAVCINDYKMTVRNA